MADGGMQPAAAGHGHEGLAEPVPVAASSAGGAEHLVLLRFKGRRKGYYHNRKGVALRVGDHCLVEADRGRDLGQVTYVGPGRPEWWSVARRQGVLQLAAPEDLARMEACRAEEDAMWATCAERIRRRGLDMNLVSVERQHDGRKITFYFTAEGRVDFRELVRDLAAAYRTRIELRQIGVRDEAKLLDGVGKCGRQLCCTSWLREFTPVSIRMAKNQQLPLNPDEISGVCGRLLCCLSYEDDLYREQNKKMPKLGAEVITPQGAARVRHIHPLKETVTVML